MRAEEYVIVVVSRLIPNAVAVQVVTNTYTNETYVLYQCGTRRPSGSVTRGAKVFQIPLTSVSVPDTVPYAFLVGSVV